MVNQSFNLVMTNILVGLAHGHPYLRPASQQVKSLGYKVFCIERKVVSSAGSVTPEAIIYSSKADHALLGEWTQAPIGHANDRKLSQINKYTQLEKKDLVEVGGMPDPGGSTNSLWLVVVPSNVEDYHGRILPHLNRTMLCSLEIDATGIKINYHVGRFIDEQLSAIIQNGISAKRIPVGYVPVSTDDLKCNEFAESIAQQIVSYAVKKNIEFSCDDICSSVFKLSWPLFGEEKKQSIRRAAKAIIDSLESKKYCKEWISRISDSPRKWTLVLQDGKDLTSSMAKLRNRIERYLAEEFKGNYQYDLFDDPEIINEENGSYITKRTITL